MSEVPNFARLSASVGGGALMKPCHNSLLVWFLHRAESANTMDRHEPARTAHNLPPCQDS
jgi:hypothetical protein